MFVPGKPFQYSLLFVGKAYPRVEASERFFIRDRLLALTTNIRLGLPGANTLVNYEKS